MASGTANIFFLLKKTCPRKESTAYDANGGARGMYFASKGENEEGQGKWLSSSSPSERSRNGQCG